jgi:hypothetical protein
MQLYAMPLVISHVSRGVSMSCRKRKQNFENSLGDQPAQCYSADIDRGFEIMS